jgi:transcriptional regulator with XRE-family HTH domain
MISVPQIKAARALLDWTQADLARASGMHLNVINNIERGTTNPRQATMEKLQAALEGHGIALIGSRGVELKRDAVTSLKFEGDDFIRALTREIIAAVNPGDEILSLLGDIRIFAAHDPDANKTWYAEKEARHLRERFITRDMPGFYPRQSENFRVVAPETLGPVDTILFADRIAHIFWSAREVLILKGEDLAKTQRALFEHLWQAGHEPVRAVRAAED